MSLYRIKQLEWKQTGRTTYESRGYVIYREGFLERQDQWGAYRAAFSGPMDRWDGVGLLGSKEEAKAACESHRRKELEMELEPALQPKAKLPSEPGLYWWLKSGFRSMWLVTDDGEDAIRFTCLLGSLPDDCKMTDALNHGQWIRIPEPEEKE